MLVTEAPVTRPPGRTRRLLSRRALVLGASIVASIAAVFWPLWVAMMAGVSDRESFPKIDFFTFYAASSLALDGVASSAYEAEAIWRAEYVLPGGGDGGFLAWLNPPTFLFVVLPLALLPVAASYVLWVLMTAFFAGAAVYRMATDKTLALVGGIAFPASLVNLVIGHNGFVMAGGWHGAYIFCETALSLRGWP